MLLDFFKKINQSKISKLIYIGIFFSLLFIIFFNISDSNYPVAQMASDNSTISTLNSPSDSLSLNLNLKRIDVQLDILLNKITNRDSTFLFEHAYIMHSAVFPSILNFTTNLNKEKSQQLEEYLADLPLMIKSNQNPNLVKNQINNIKNILQYFDSKI
ncbi:MAG: hypothetical protein ACTHKF_03800, partial [Candidatus Nitrosocosmicus sp.]